jgi:3-deoxy-D-manno-octulosonic-acid transferase
VILRLYSALWIALLLPAWALWAWRTRASRALAPGRWRERFARGPLPQRACGGVVVHAASVGESVAALPLLRELQRQRPDLPLLVTGTTFTGAERLQRELGDRIDHRFLPFDLPGASARFLDRVRPRVLVLMETELWPNLLAAARARGIPVVLASARLSATSARGYARAMPLAGPMLRGLHRVLAQTGRIARRFRALGLPAARIEVVGNLKFDLAVPPERVVSARQMRATLGDRPVCVAGSTHAGDEQALLAAWRGVRAVHPEALLVIVPRHPERFDEAARAIVEAGWRAPRRSLGEVPAPGDAVWLGDTMGEMLWWFHLADIAFIGGSLIERGGHSPLEAMAAAVPVLSGPSVTNFAEIFADLGRAGGWWRVDGEDGLCDALDTLLADDTRRRAMGKGARRLFEACAGAAGRGAAAVLRVLESPQGSVQRVDDGRQAVWTALDRTAALPPQPFDPAAWGGHGRVGRPRGGRGTAWFLHADGHAFVLRHFRRGGGIAKLLGDRYLGRSAVASRPMREFVLLQEMHAAGLPVPVPVAARCQRAGPGFYRGDLLLERIPDVTELASVLDTGHRPEPAQWQAVGAAIRRLHDAGVWHADLNARNLLVDRHWKVWIIDFDRGRHRSGERWKAANLRRLLRSLRKEAARHPGSAWHEEDWGWLMRGYGGVSGAPTLAAEHDRRA